MTKEEKSLKAGNGKQIKIKLPKVIGLKNTGRLQVFAGGNRAYTIWYDQK